MQGVCRMQWGCMSMLILCELMEQHANLAWLGRAGHINVGFDS